MKLFYKVMLIFLISSIANAEPPAGYSFLPYDVGIKKSLKENKKIFVYFGRHGCGYCDKTNRKTFTNLKVKNIISKKYVLVYINSEGMGRMALPSGERITEMQLGEKLNAIGTPIFFFLHAGGKEIVRAHGFQSTSNMLTLERFVSGKYFEKMSFSEFKRKG